ncbi:MAG: flocculation-associated PEP-CTERM protein PepA [Vicinamibacterales bacterium]
MKKLSKVWKAAGIFAVAGLALAVTPGVARADNVAFTLNEGNSIIPGTNTASYTVDDINGKYNEQVLLGATTFSATLVVNFATYLNTVNVPPPTETPVATQLGATVPGGETTDTNLYAMYTLVTVSGTYTAAPLLGNTVYVFSPTASTASIWVDPTRDTVTDFTTATVTSGGGDDLQIMNATSIFAPLSTGQVTVNGSGAVLGGFYSLTYSDPTLVSPTGPLYWTGLNLMTLVATASGDVDTTGQGSSFPLGVKGDTDITFSPTPVPEPASLVLLGTGLLGAAGARRRSKKQQ